MLTVDHPVPEPHIVHFILRGPGVEAHQGSVQANELLEQGQ